MITHEVVGSGYNNTSEVPKDDDLYYHCLNCDALIASIPGDNVGCECGNVFIDWDYRRLIVEEFDKFEVVRKITS